MRHISILFAALFTVSFASCAQAKPSLSDAVTVEAITLTLPEWPLNDDASPFERADARWERHGAMRETLKHLLDQREEQLGFKGAEQTTLVAGIELSQQSWWAFGRLSPQQSVYVALIEAPETFASDKDSLDVCVITFNPDAMPSGIELRHYRLLFAVLIESKCGTDALNLSEGSLHSSLTREFSPQPYRLYATQEFESGVEVDVLTKDYERGERVDILGMVAAHLGITQPAQTQIGKAKGFFVLSDGRVAAFRTFDANAVHAVCVIKGATWPEALQGRISDRARDTDHVLPYRTFCAEQLALAEREYKKAQSEDWKSLPTPPTLSREPLPMP